MKIRFLGTKANIDITSPTHRRNASACIMHDGYNILIDCGLDWQSVIMAMDPPPDALFITHGHDDHVKGLQNGSPCPVYATQETWHIIDTYPIASEQRHVIESGEIYSFGDLDIMPHALSHSTRAPAVGYRIEDSDAAIFYITDVARIDNAEKALEQIDLYIGDGSLITRTMLVRTHDDTVTGHAPIEQQLKWCHTYGVSRALFTHCGRVIVRQDRHTVAAQIESLGKEYGVDAGIAHDGMCVDLS